MQQSYPKPARAIARLFRGEACPQVPFYKKSKILRQTRRCIVLSILAATLLSAHSAAQNILARKSVVPPTGLEIVLTAGEPELRVDGVPFFVHAAQFDYFRIPDRKSVV